MNRLIKRYILKAQRDKSNADVNEGALKEIKQDISGLKFELLECSKHDMDNMQKLIQHLGEAGLIQHPEKENPGI